MSVVNFTLFWSITSLKAGQPQPESNFVSDVNNVSLQTTQVYKPASVVLLYFPVKALEKIIKVLFVPQVFRNSYLSVPFSWVTWYCMGDKRFFKSALQSTDSPWLMVLPIELILLLNRKIPVNRNTLLWQYIHYCMCVNVKTINII